MRIIILLLAWAASSGAAHADLNDIAQRLQTEHGFIGVALGYADSDEVIDVSAYGLRQLEGSEDVSADDRWHLGSVTKSMTSIVIGTLVDDGILSFDMTLPDALPNFPMHESWQDVTLRQVLDHNAGLPRDFRVGVLLRKDVPLQTRVEARANVLEEILAKPAALSLFSYSNVGYTLLGHIIETHTGKVWEQAISDRLFTPLNITSAGFGAPVGDQPLGHKVQFGLFLSAIDSSSAWADNTPIIGPAGTVHMSISDLLAYGQELLRTSHGADGIVTSETFQALFDGGPPYRGGLVTQNNAEIDGAFYWHNGTNTMWYAILVILPDQDRVVAITTNRYFAEIEDAIWPAIIEISKY